MQIFRVSRFTFARVIKRKSTEEYSCVPYIIALLNCLLYTWYGLPIVSYRWENFPVATINGLGILLEFSFVLVYLWFASTREKIKVVVILIPVILAFGIISATSAFMIHNHHQRKAFVGSVGVVASAAMYGSPLVAVVSHMYTS
ncbi:unnamed protein product [Linum tenue]|uniref:Uncharacterized protein n=1 Tax=Linum tenue TaxID=586396 RepID=A0AAV0MV17_9ROSI|nr:unnamed protein product [Linum tenue]